MLLAALISTFISDLLDYRILRNHCYSFRPSQRANLKSLTLGDRVDSGIGLPMVTVLESTLEWT
jgi:hypothetical protein